MVGSVDILQPVRAVAPWPTVGSTAMVAATLAAILALPPGRAGAQSRFELSPFGSRNASLAGDPILVGAALTTYGSSLGGILGMRFDYLSNLGAYVAFTGSVVNTLGLVNVNCGVYDVQAVHVRGRLVLTNTIPTAAYRGAGRPVASYALERLVDEAARELGLDPAELRRRNMIPAAKMPKAGDTSFAFEGVPISYTATPFMMQMNEGKLLRKPGAAPPKKAPVRRRPAAKKPAQ